jgi:hypothetical protein
MSINTTLGILSAIAFLLPPLIIIYFRLFNLCLIALAIYFFGVFAYNLMSANIIVVDIYTRQKVGIVTNYLDVPLILVYMLIFCVEKWKQKVIFSSLIIFLAYELIIFYHYQVTPASSLYVMGPGIILVMMISMYFFISNIKHTIIQGKGIGKTLMASGVLFAYGCYSLVYIFAYILKTPNKTDVFTIYYAASIIFSLLMSAGLVWLKKRLDQIKEVQIARKELSVFFNS